MKRHKRISLSRVAPAVALAAALVMSACGSSDGGDTSASGDTSANQQSAADEGDSSGSSGASGDQDAIVLKIGHNQADDTTLNKTMLDVAKEVEEKTDGRVTIKVYPNSQLGTIPDLVEQAVKPGSDVLAFLNGVTAAEQGSPKMGLLYAAYLFDSADQANSFVESDEFKGWEDQLAKNGNLHILSFNWFFGARHIISSKGYAEPADMKGDKLRVPNNQALIDFFKALPIEPTQMDGSEVYSGISQGVIDAAEGPYSQMIGWSLPEIAKTITLTGHIYEVDGFAINQQVWEKISPQDQEAVQAAFTHGGEAMTEATISEAGKLRQQLEDEGVTFVDADRDAYREVATKVYDKFPDWPEGFYSEVRNQIVSSSK